MGRSWQLVRAWIVLAAGGFMGLAGAVIASLWLPARWAAPLGGAIGALTAVVTDRAKRHLDHRWDLRQQLPQSIALHSRSGRYPRVRDVADPVLIGVHRAEARSDEAVHTSTAGLPAYIPRHIDPELRAALFQAGMTVVVGESTAGKSRAAFEAMRSQRPDHLLAVPASREALGAVVESLSDVLHAVLWLDDLERFLGPGGLTPAIVDGLTTKSGREIVLLATMRTVEYERFTARSAPAAGDEERSAWWASRDVVRTARLIFLDRLWSPPELEAAARFETDPRIARALRQADAFGIAETLAAGPVLLRDWRNAWTPGAHPRAAALVSAAVDCRRAGLSEPVSRDLLQELHGHYLQAHGGHALRPEPLHEAWAWALQPVHGASSLLIPAGPTDQDASYLAFDYLIDQPGHEPIPAETWELLLAHATPSQASHIASRAFWRVRTVFHAAIASGTVNEILARAQALADHADYAQAIHLLSEALKAPDIDEPVNLEWRRTLRHQTAFYHLQARHLDQAEAGFRELLAEAEQTMPPSDEYLQIVRHNLASCARRRGDLSGALAQFQRILTDRQRYLGTSDMNTLDTRRVIADIIGEMGDHALALRQARDVLADEEQALGRDHTNTLESRQIVAKYLAETGDLEAAVEALQQLIPDLTLALGADHPDVLDARWDIARYQARNGNRAIALRQFQEVIAAKERLLGRDSTDLEHARQELQRLITENGIP